MPHEAKQIRRLRRCPRCQRPYLQYCVHCYIADMGQERRDLLKRLGINDKFVMEKLKKAVETGSLMALFKLMHLMQFELMAIPLKDVGDEAIHASLSQMLEELEACETALDVESEPGTLPQLPAPPEK